MSFKNPNFRWIFLYIFTFIIWGAYRLFEQFPTWIDEIIFKPVLKFAPILYVVFKIETKNWGSLGFSKKNLRHNFIWGVGVGLLLIMIRILTKDFVQEDLKINPMHLTILGFVLAAITAAAVGFLEEVMFRGYFFQRIWWSTQSEFTANILSSALSAVAHLPISVFFFNYFDTNLFFYIAQAIFMSMLFAFLFARRGSILVSMIAHGMWNFSNYLVI